MFGSAVDPGEILEGELAEFGVTLTGDSALRFWALCLPIG